MDPKSVGALAGLIGAALATYMAATPAHWEELRAKLDPPVVDAGVP